MIRVKRCALPTVVCVSVLVACNLLFLSAWAAGENDATGETKRLPRQVRFNGVLVDAAGVPLTGVQGVTFALYSEQTGGAPLWLETQNVTADDQGRYSVLLGSMREDGLPQDVFTSNEARWLGVQVNQPGAVEQARVLLVSVPYALKAADAETLGGKPVAAFLLAPTASSGQSSEGAEAAAINDGPPTASVAVANRLVKYTDGAGTQDSSNVTDDGTNVGIGSPSTGAKLHIAGSVPGTATSDLLSLSTTDGAIRSEITARGLQFWRFNNGVDNAGQIAFATPGGSPGIVMWTGPTFDQNRFDIANYGSQFSLGYNADSGGQVLNIKPGGNVGIGTASPAAKLEVLSAGFLLGSFRNSGTGGDHTALVDIQNGDGGLWRQGVGGVGNGFGLSAEQYYLEHAGAGVRLLVDNLGRVGIGTTSPASKLTVNSGVSTNIGDTGCGAGSFGGITFVNAPSGCANYNVMGSISTLYLNRPSGGDIRFRENNGDQMTIQAGGRVGIGTTSPSGAQLHTVSSANVAAIKGEHTANSGSAYGVSGLSASTSGRGVFGSATATCCSTYGVYGENAANGGAGVLGNATSTIGVTHGGIFQSASSNGRGIFGWSTSSTGTTYGVMGKSESNIGYGGWFLNSNSSGVALAAEDAFGFPVLTVRANGKVGVQNDTPLDTFDVGGDMRVGSRVDVTGCVKDRDGTIIAGACSSDARLKKNIIPFANLLDKVSRLQPVYFDWRAEEYPERHFGSSRSFGLIAQEVEQILPELVAEDREGYKTVKYNELPLLTLQAVRELKQVNDRLREELDGLRAEILTIRARLGVEISRSQ